VKLLAIIQREVKQRRNAMEEYIKGKRDDLVEQAKAEIAVLESYLPQQLSDEELGTMAKQIIEELKATPKEFGKVMGKLVPW
jgi:uncharacterized protein